MKRKTLLFGAVIAALLMLMMPSISAVEQNETEPLKNGRWGILSLWTAAAIGAMNKGYYDVAFSFMIMGIICFILGSDATPPDPGAY